MSAISLADTDRPRPEPGDGSPPGATDGSTPGATDGSNPGATDGSAPGATAPGRLAALDVLRGIAILGTMATNIGIFLGMADRTTQLTPLDGALSTGLGLITDGKFIGLLTIMFGIGLEIQRQSVVRKGETWLGSYPWRAALLVLDGLLNYIFIFEFDVLMGYGLTGLVVCVVLAGSPRVQTWVMGVGIALHLVLLTVLAAPWETWRTLQSGAEDDLAPRSTAEMDQAAAAMGLTREQFLAQVGSGAPGAGMGSYWDGVQARVADFWVGRAEIPIMFVMGLGVFLIGARLYRAGLFAERGARLRRRMMLLAFGVGLPIDWGTRLFLSDYAGSYNRYLTSLFVSFGLLALVAHVYARGRRPGRVGRAVANVGKMALTCYIGQNLIASILFYDWGLGLARHLHWGVWNDIVAWLAVSTILLVGSALWLRRFRRGPVEWVWHASHQRLVRLTMPLVERVNARRAARRAGRCVDTAA